MASKPLLVAAIDFGTTYSGAAISFSHEYEKDPSQVYALKVGNPTMSMKTMTCILIKPDGQTCYKFGEDADSHYYEGLDKAERKKWFLFKRFKMELYDADLKGKDVKNLHLKDVSGRELPAKRVFSLAIRHLMEDVLQHCNNRIQGMVGDKEIGWVLTVPAIWHDQAKGFMREAAEEAGISRDRLTIALEPEAASIFCQHVPLVRDQPDVAKLVPFKVGMKYIVVDCGGGTVDITVHQVTDKAITSTVGDGSSSKGYFVKEIRKARGNDMGGTKVDDAFVKYLEKLVGKGILNDYRSTHDVAFRDLMMSFEEKKRKVQADGTNMTISSQLADFFAERKKTSLKDHLADKGNTDVSVPVPGKLRFENNVACSFFSDSIMAIISKLDKLCREPDMGNCNTLLMVGGYSESPLLISRIKESFPGKDVICPRESGLAVLKGAVIFGHNPGAVSERISRFTYGTDLTRNRFDTIVEMGDRLVVGESNRVKRYKPEKDTQTSASVNIYVSPRESPKSLDEEDCVRIIKRGFPMRNTAGGTKRRIEMCMVFGGTEFKVHVKNVDTDYEETFYVTSWD